MPTLSVIEVPGPGQSHFATLLYLHLRTHKDIDVQVGNGDSHWDSVDLGDIVDGLRAACPPRPRPTDSESPGVLNISYKEDRGVISKLMSRFRRRPRESLTIRLLDSWIDIVQFASDILPLREGLSEKDLRQEIEDQCHDPNLVQALYDTCSWQTPSASWWTPGKSGKDQGTP